MNRRLDFPLTALKVCIHKKTKRKTKLYTDLGITKYKYSETEHSEWHYTHRCTSEMPQYTKTYNNYQTSQKHCTIHTHPNIPHLQITPAYLYVLFHKTCLLQDILDASRENTTLISSH
jgi:hypothetical protein